MTYPDTRPFYRPFAQPVTFNHCPCTEGCSVDNEPQLVYSPYKITITVILMVIIFYMCIIL